MKKYIYSLLAIPILSLLFSACKKDEASAGQLLIQSPVINKLSRSFVQEGDTLVIYGSALAQDHRITEVFINDRPCQLLKSSTDSLQVKVPAKTRSGNVVVTISVGNQFNSVNGPLLEIKPTPLIRSFWPKYGYPGETIALIVENFSVNNTDNHIFLGADAVQITGGNSKDTLLVTLPANAHTAGFRWNTYDGVIQQMDTAFPVRQTSYSVSNAMSWLQADPAFTFMDTLVRGYPVLSGINYKDYYKRLYDTVLNYINNNARSYTIFLPADMGYYNSSITLNGFIEKIKNQPYNYHFGLAASIVPDMQLSLSAMQEGDLYNTAFTMLLQYYPDGSDDYKNKIQITKENGVKYANLLGIYGETSARVKIIRAHKIGNATIIETDGELGYFAF